MPELPEVEIYRRYFEETALGLTVTHLEVEDPRQLTVDEEVLREALRKVRLVKTDRIGKHFLVTLSSGKILVLHFGMTGGLAYYRDAADTPKFARVVFLFSNGFHLAFVDPRKFGRIGLADSVAAYRQEKGLGPDALAMTLAQLEAGLQGRKAPIKALLLDQKILAGIGNWIADEMLYQAGIYPAKPANQLSRAELERLYRAMGQVLQTAIAEEAIYSNFPPSFLIHARGWEEVRLTTPAEREVCPRHGTALSIHKVGGRTTYSCPVCQPD
jgi:formamidopyrimidine-DNA glycosylase